MKSNKFVLTGSIASGKSAVSDILKRDGFTILDADEISRNMTASGGKLLPDIREEFGNDVFKGDALDREALSAIVFSNSEKRGLLNSIMHPAIINEMLRMGEESEKDIIIFDIPLFFEIKDSFDLEKLFDGIIVVDVSHETRLQRLMKRDNINENYALKKIESQIPGEDKARFADYIIRNDGDLKELEFEVKKLEDWLRNYEA